MGMITFVDASKNSHEVEIVPGETVMTHALNNMIDGIVAECGGSLSCATCHCMVADDWSSRFSDVDGDENALLEAVPERMPNSRLSCQLEVDESMDGLIIHLPESQY